MAVTKTTPRPTKEEMEKYDQNEKIKKRNKTVDDSDREHRKKRSKKYSPDRTSSDSAPKTRSPASALHDLEVTIEEVKKHLLQENHELLRKLNRLEARVFELESHKS